MYSWSELRHEPGRKPGAVTRYRPEFMLPSAWSHGSFASTGPLVRYPASGRIVCIPDKWPLAQLLPTGPRHTVTAGCCDYSPMDREHERFRNRGQLAIHLSNEDGSTEDQKPRSRWRRISAPRCFKPRQRLRCKSSRDCFLLFWMALRSSARLENEN
jgi:hypothetical protein